MNITLANGALHTLHPQNATPPMSAAFALLGADPKSALSIPAGIVIGLVASFVQSLGLTIQRKSHVLDQSLPEHRRRVEHRRPLWLLGFAIFISSNLIGSLVQIASLPVVILAPLGAVSLLWNAFFARLILGDRFSPWMILGTILIAGGAILIAVFGIVPEPTRSLEDLLELFRRPAFLAYFSTLAFVVVVCLAITHITEFALSRRVAGLEPSEEEGDEDLVLTPSSTIIDMSHTSTAIGSDVNEEHHSRAATEQTPLLFDRKSQVASPTPDATLHSLNRTRLLVAISYASFSGILSGMCLIFAKSGVELLLLTLGGQNQFMRWETWVLLLGLVIFALLQLWYLHKALILADPTLVCPSAFCFYNLSSIVNGMVYFNQLSLIKPLHLGLVILGIFVLLGGVWVVSIQSGGGGVDIGTWSGEETELLGPDGAFCDEPESALPELDAAANDEGQEIPLSRSSRPISRDVRIGPVPMDRETRSESSIVNNLSSAHERLRHSLPEIHHSPQDELREEESGTPRRRNSLLSTSTGLRPAVDAHSTLPVSPTYQTRYTLRHRLTSHEMFPGRLSSYSSIVSGHGGAGTSGSGVHGPLSPPINPVSTLGSGFQIGLSPVSPGFTLTPKVRKPRLGGLGRSSVVGDRERERERRRTVSEGDVNRLLTARFDEDGAPVVPSGEDEEGGEERGEYFSAEARADGADRPVGDARGRWAWLRRLVTRDGKE
ncbi:hypothetical protein D9611_006806 [Ephemerocybe angulata]|uniref:Uncharacterized protein n=1 Tax=Ephemerocybe angulata TaxID=980116 RepID=A0A8H5B1Q4_9AGAR|nr:hypothetical protein D9611_006806 [Tulosesus angulatus]